jgi:hypothetical protein
MVPQPFATGRNQPYPDSWAVTKDPWYPGYKTPTTCTDFHLQHMPPVSRQNEDLVYLFSVYILLGTFMGYASLNHAS